MGGTWERLHGRAIALQENNAPVTWQAICLSPAMRQLSKAGPNPDTRFDQSARANFFASNCVSAVNTEPSTRAPHMRTAEFAGTAESKRTRAKAGQTDGEEVDMFTCFKPEELIRS